MRYRIPGVNFTVHVIKGINYIALLHDVTCLKLKPIPMYRTTYLQPTRRLNHQPRKRHHHSIFQCCRANEITSHQRWSAGRHSFHRLYDDLIPFVCLLLFNPFSLRASQIFRVNQVFPLTPASWVGGIRIPDPHLSVLFICKRGLFPANCPGKIMNKS
jgi:hypothetical protein